MQMGFLFARAARFRHRLILISLLNLLGALATLAVPWLAGQLIGGVLDPGTVGLRGVVALLLGALAASTLLAIAARIQSEAAAGRILAHLRMEAYSHIQLMPMEFIDRSRQGDLLSLMTWEVTNLSSFLTGTLANAPSMLFTAGGAVVLLFIIDPVLALFVPALVPVFFIALKLVGRRLRDIGVEARRAESQVISTADSHLTMLPAIRAFAVEQAERERYAETVERSRQLQLASARSSAAIGPLTGLVAAISAVLIVVVVGDSAGGDRSPAELFSFLLYAALLTRPVGSLADSYGRYQVARGTLARLEAMMGEPPEPGHELPASMAPLPDGPRGDIRFENVRFAYPVRPPVLCDADLHIRAGEVIAVTGENGAGKSTLISLLLRFYQPAGGTISLDGRDIAAMPVGQLRRAIGFVPQRPLLFNGNVRDNVAFGLPDAGMAQIERALCLSQAEEFVARLPQGLDTMIGDNGVRLSGGQRQRIALARALLKDPPILIFDEATSMYDMESEAAFVEACTTALEGRTVILITHRPASLALADRIVCVRDGKVWPAAE